MEFHLLWLVCRKIEQFTIAGKLLRFWTQALISGELWPLINLVSSGDAAAGEDRVFFSAINQMVLLLGTESASEDHELTPGCQQQQL